MNPLYGTSVMISRNIKPPVVENPYLTFYSPDGEFELYIYRPYSSGVSLWEGVMEYSTDLMNWSTWVKRQGSSENMRLSSSDGYLYVRGRGNTTMGTSDVNGSWRFTGSNIHCIGNIENLLDYEAVSQGVHPEMSVSCFAHMFDQAGDLTNVEELILPSGKLSVDCCALMFNYGSLSKPPKMPSKELNDACYHSMFAYSSLSEPPVLPATTMYRSCYGGTFWGCNRLKKPPKLPAMQLAKDCYSSMFERCMNLEEIPELPATELADGCYYRMFATNIDQRPPTLLNLPILPATQLADLCYGNMFEGRIGIKLSTERTGEYVYAYRIPYSGTGSMDPEYGRALSYMFTRTGGTFTGTPSINTTYYTDHEPI